MALSKEEFLHLCKLAKLAPDAENQEYFSAQCGNILTYMDKLSELDVVPLYSPVELNAAACLQGGLGDGRVDEARRTCSRGEILANAPERGGEDGEFFLVPRIVEGKQ